MLAINDPKLIPLRNAALNFYNDEGGPCGATFVVDGRHLQVTINEVDPNSLSQGKYRVMVNGVMVGLAQKTNFDQVVVCNGRNYRVIKLIESKFILHCEEVNRDQELQR